MAALPRASPAPAAARVRPGACHARLEAIRASRRLSPPADGKSVHAFAYSTPEAARHGLSAMQSQAQGTTANAISPPRLFLELLHAGVTFLVVDPAFPTQLMYIREALQAMLELREAAAPPE